MISIIIPLYNKESTIASSINSILKQQFQDVEILVINDGSTDSSLEIIKGIDSTKVHIINKKNGGVSSARNLGIESASGDWLLFLDADDSLTIDSLSVFDSAIKEYNKASIILADFVTILGDNQIRKSGKLQHKGYLINVFKYKFFEKLDFRLGSFVVNKTCCQSLRFDESISNGEDLLFIDDLLLNNRVAYVNDIVMSYDRTESSLSNKRQKVDKYCTWNMPLSHNYFYNLLVGGNILKNTVSFVLKGEFSNAFQLFIKRLPVLHWEFLYFLYFLFFKIFNSKE